MRSKIDFLESVIFQFHARILSSLVAQSIKSYGHFSDLGVEIALSHRHVEFFQVKQIHQSTASERTTRVDTGQTTRDVGPVFGYCWANVAGCGSNCGGDNATCHASSVIFNSIKCLFLSTRKNSVLSDYSVTRSDITRWEEGYITHPLP